MRRVVVTGMGVVSPNGIGKTAFCQAILDGKSGVKLISSFDTKDLPVKIAGEIQNFNELDWIDAQERKHVSRVVPLAVAASSEAIQDANLDPARRSGQARSAAERIRAVSGFERSRGSGEIDPL